METEHPDPAEIADLRAALSDRALAPLGWDAVRTLEASHSVVLPEPYRTFVAEVAAGDPGGPPDYGLVPPEVAVVGAPKRDRNLALPFPIETHWIWEGDECVDEDAQLAVFDHGSLRLGTDGGGLYWHLVVTGPQRGNIWLLCDIGAVPFGSTYGHTTGAPGFAGWMRHWASGRPWWDRTPASTPDDAP